MINKLIYRVKMYRMLLDDPEWIILNLNKARILGISYHWWHVFLCFTNDLYRFLYDFNGQINFIGWAFGCVAIYWRKRTHEFMLYFKKMVSIDPTKSEYPTFKGIFWKYNWIIREKGKSKNSKNSLAPFPPLCF